MSVAVVVLSLEKEKERRRCLKDELRRGKVRDGEGKDGSLLVVGGSMLEELMKLIELRLAAETEENVVEAFVSLSFLNGCSHEGEDEEEAADVDSSVKGRLLWREEDLSARG